MYKLISSAPRIAALISLIISGLHCSAQTKDIYGCQQPEQLILAREHLTRLDNKKALSIARPFLLSRNLDYCDSLAFAEALLISGAAELNLGFHEEAIHHLWKSKSIIMLTSKDPCSLTRVYNNIGTYFYLINLIDSASLYYQQAYIEIKTCPSVIDNILLLINWASLNNYIGNNLKALNQSTEALRLIDPSNRKQQFEVHYLLGNIHYSLLDYSKAERHYLIALTHTGSNNDPKAISANLNLISIHTLSGKLDKAKEAALNLERQNTSFLDRVYLHRAKAEIFRTEKRFDQEIFEHLKTIREIETNPVNPDTDYEMAFTLIYCAEAVLHFNVSDSMNWALSDLNSALDILRVQSGSNSIDLSRVYTLIGKVYHRLNQPYHALCYFDSSYISLGLNIHDDLDYNSVETLSLQNAEYESLLLETKTNLADVLNSLPGYQVTKGFILKCINRLCQSTISLIQELRRNLSFDRSRMMFAESNADFLQVAMEVSYQCFSFFSDEQYVQDHLRASEMLKAQLLKEQLKERETVDITEADGNILQQEQVLKDSIDWYSQQIASETEEHIIRSLKIGEYLLRQRRDSVLAYLKNNLPEYYQSKYDIREYNLNEISAFLDDNQSLLIFSEGKHSLYRIHLTESNVSFSRIDKSDSLEQNMRQFKETISVNPVFSQSSIDSRNAFFRSSTMLSESLLGNDKSRFRKHLTIVNCTYLAQIPFECLLTGPGNASFRTARYLIRDHIVDYANTIDFVYRISNKQYQNVLAIAPKYESDNQDELYFLPNQESEIASLTSSFTDTKVMRDTRIHKENLIRSLDQFDILHIAAHTLINSNSDSTAIILGINAGAHDANLSLNDIKHFRWATKGLVVLNSCNTGVGNILPSDGIQSIGWAFMYAGAREICISLWESNDYSNARTLSQFYKQLSRRSSGQALTQSKLEYINEADELTAHPYYWANSVLYRL